RAFAVSRCIPTIPSSHFLLFLPPPPPPSPPSPYTTLFRSLPPLPRSPRSLNGRPAYGYFLAVPVYRHANSDSSHAGGLARWMRTDRKSTRLNSSHVSISYAVFCLKKKTTSRNTRHSA